MGFALKPDVRRKAGSRTYEWACENGVFAAFSLPFVFLGIVTLAMVLR
jgi:hypothetical protein